MRKRCREVCFVAYVPRHHRPLQPLLSTAKLRSRECKRTGASISVSPSRPSRTQSESTQCEREDLAREKLRAVGRTALLTFRSKQCWPRGAGALRSAEAASAVPRPRAGHAEPSTRSAPEPAPHRSTSKSHRFAPALRARASPLLRGSPLAHGPRLQARNAHGAERRWPRARGFLACPRLRYSLALPCVRRYRADARKTNTESTRRDCTESRSGLASLAGPWQSKSACCNIPRATTERPYVPGVTKIMDKSQM